LPCGLSYFNFACVTALLLYIPVVAE